MKYTAEKILNAIKRYPEDKPNHGEHIWMQSLSRDMWMSFIGNNSNEMFLFHENSQNGAWFIDIPGAPEELRPLPYPQNKPEKEGKYICHFKPYIVGCAPNNKDHWNENYWLVDDIDGNSDWQNAWNLVDFFINYPLEEEKMEEKKIQSIRVDYQSGFGAAIYIQRDTNEEFLRDICAYHGYDITKRQPEIAPCPFCGHDCEVDVAINKHGRAFIGEKKQVYCEKDVSCGYRGPFAFTAEEAIEKHNLIAGKDK